MTPTTDLRFINWNANGIRERIDELLLLADRVSADIIFITETRLAPSVTISTPGYICYRKDRPLKVRPDGKRNHAAGGVAILVRNHLKHHEFVLPPTSSLLETVAIQISLDSSIHTLIAAYCPGRNANLHSDLSTVLKTSDRIVIAGDLNSKHQRLNSKGANPNGRSLIKLMDDTGIDIVLPDAPTCHKRQTASFLDIVLARNVPIPSGLKTLQELSSDHLPVTFTIGGSYLSTRDIARYDLTKADWPAFKSHINSSVNLSAATLSTPEDIDGEVYTLTGIINNARDNHIPLEPRRTSPRIKLPGEVYDLIKERNSLRNLWYRKRDRFTKSLVNHLSKQIHSEVQRLKNESWAAKLESLKYSDGTMWRLAKALRRKRDMIPPLTSGGVVVYADDDKANALADGFAVSHALTTGMCDAQTEKSVRATLDQLAECERPVRSVKLVRPYEVFKIISRLPKRKAPGPDDITNTLLKYLPTKAHVVLAKIFNACLLLGHFPTQWKCPNVIPIHKPGKDKVLPVSYRPISLLCCLSKVLERVILTRYAPYQRSALQHEQFGFRPDHSTDKQLIRLTDHITKGFNMKRKTGMVFLDIEKAFDTVWHDGLIHKLHKTGVPPYIIDILRSYLTDRHFVVRAGEGQSSRRPVPAGVPQGSVLAPQLFSHYIADLPIPKRCAIALYADDTACYTTSRVNSFIIRTLQSALDEITLFYHKWKIKVNESKTEAILFDHKQNRQSPTECIRSGGVRIEWSKVVKYLGVHLDRTLNWFPHTRAARAKGYIGKHSLFPLLCSKSPISLEHKLRLYKAIIKPFMMYASPVFSSARESALHKLQVVQNNCLRLILGVSRQSTHKLHKLAKVPTLRMDTRKFTRNLFDSIDKSKNPLLKGIGKETPDSLKNHYRYRFPHHILLGDRATVSDNSRGTLYTN